MRILSGMAHIEYTTVRRPMPVQLQIQETTGLSFSHGGNLSGVKCSGADEIRRRVGSPVAEE